MKKILSWWKRFWTIQGCANCGAETINNATYCSFDCQAEHSW